MRSDLKTYALEDCLEALIDYRGKTPRKTDAGIPLVTAKVVKNGRIEAPNEFVAPEDFDAWMTRGLPKLGDVVMTTEAPLGEVGQIHQLPVALAQRIVTLRGRPKVLHNDYLLYALQSEVVQMQLRGRSSGTTVVGIKQSELRKVTLDLPPFEVQREVASVMKALDDRIDLLRQTNATLESIAQALFKSWFIDFDPVRAKAEGREPEGMDAATAALFPAEFEQSALGLIPKGWSAGSIYEVAKVRYGAPFASKLFNSEGVGKPLVRIRDLKDEAPGVWTPETHPKGYVLQPGDIVVGMDGEFRAYLWGGELAWMNQRVCAFEPCNGHSAAFVRNAIAAPLAHVEMTETATTVIHLGKGDIDRFRTVVPPPSIASAYAAVSQVLYDRIVCNKQGARALASIRDELLPRLISGKLRLPEAQEQVEEAVA